MEKFHCKHPKTIHTVFLCVLKCKNSRRQMLIIRGPLRIAYSQDRQCITIYIYINILFSPSLSLSLTHIYRSSSIYRLTITMDDDDDGRREKLLLSRRCRILLVGRRSVIMFNGKLSGCVVYVCVCLSGCVGLLAEK